MTVRERIYERIAKLDDDVLPELLLDLEALEERQSRPVSPGLIKMVQDIHAHTQDMDPEELDSLIDEAVQDARRR